MDYRLLITSDTHGCISPYSYSDHQELTKGLAKLSTAIAELRTDNTLLIDNGDALQGSPLLYHHYLFNAKQINPMAKVFNYLGYDYLNSGNHDFNFGLTNMKAFYHDTDALWLTGNINENGQSINKPYHVHQFSNGLRIALLGCVTQHIPNWEHPDNIRNITFVNCLKFVEETVELIQRTEKVAQIICLYHGGIERDLVTHQPNETLSGENQGYEICQRVKGLDILVTGHQHQSVITRINDILVTQTAHDAQEIAVIEVHDGRISAYLKPVPDTVDQNLLALVADEEQQTQTWLDVPLGHLISGDLLISDMFEARLHKHPLVSFLNQVQMASTNTDISLVGLANSVVGFRHEISMRDIIASYVYPNTLTVLEITGKTLKKALERSAEYFALQNGRISINPKFTAPKPKHYNYDMFDGIEYTIKVSNPIGQRIVSLTYHQEPIAEDRLYRVAMNNYRSVGGGDFFMYKSGTIIHDTQKHIVDCIADYIIEHHEITVDHQDNIHVII